MIGIFIALISGALMSVQGVFNTEVTKASSVWVSASWVQFSALLDESSGRLPGQSQIHASGRRNRSLYHLYGD